MLVYEAGYEGFWFAATAAPFRQMDPAPGTPRRPEMGIMVTGPAALADRTG